jgi:hypothetical protein
MTLPEKYKIVRALTPATDAAGREGDVVSLKNVNKAYIVAQVAQGDANVVLFTVSQCQHVNNVGIKAIANAVPIWSNLDCAASDTLVRRTDAVNYTTDAGVKNKMIVFQIDPATLDTANGFDCITITTAASNVGNVTAATYYLDMRFQEDVPPSAILD